MDILNHISAITIPILTQLHLIQEPVVSAAASGSTNLDKPTKPDHPNFPCDAYMKNDKHRKHFKVINKVVPNFHPSIFCANWTENSNSTIIDPILPDFPIINTTNSTTNSTTNTTIDSNTNSTDSTTNSTANYTLVF